MTSVSSIFELVRNGDPIRLRELLAARPTLVDSRAPREEPAGRGATPLHVAAHQDDPAMALPADSDPTPI